MRKVVECLLVLCLIFILHSSQQVVAMKNLPAVQNSVLQEDCEGKHAERLAVSPDGNLIAASWYRTSTDSSQVTVWNVQTGEIIHTFEFGVARGLEFSADSRLLAAADPDKAVVWDIGEGEIIFTTEWEDDEIDVGIGFSPNSELLSMFGKSGRLWNIKSGKLVHTIPINFYGDDMLFSPDGKYLLAEGRSLDDPYADWSLSVWDVETGKRLHVFYNTYNGIFSPDGQYILTEWEELWDARTFKLVHRFDRPENTRPSDSYSFSFSQDGKYLAISAIINTAGNSYGSVELWNLSTFKMTYQLIIGKDPIVWTQFLPDNKYMVTLDGEHSTGPRSIIRIWNLSDGSQRRTFSVGDRDISDYVVLPDSRHIAVIPGQNGVVDLWRWFTRKKVRTYC